MTASVFPDSETHGLSGKDLAIALAVVLPLAAIIAPYRSVHLPQLFILGVALFGGFWCIRMAVVDVEQLLFVFLLYIPFQKVLPGDFGGFAKAVNFTNVFLLLLFMGWLARKHSGVDTAPPRRWTLLDSAVVVFLATTSLCVAAQSLRETQEIRYELFSDLKGWLTPFVAYFLVTAIGSSTKTVKKMLLAVLVTTSMIGLLGVKEFWIDMGGATRHNLEEVRIEVTSGPSNLGAFFAYYLPYLVALWLSNIWRIGYWAFVFPLVWCMDALRTTFSRGAALAFLAGVLAIVWKRSKIAFVLVAMVAAAVVQSGEISLPYGVFGRMTETYNPSRPGSSVSEKLDTSAKKRLVIWEGGLQMVREHPYFGVGYGRFPREIGRYKPEVAGMDPHNNFLKIASEMGIPALVSFAFLMAMCFWRGYRLYGKVEDPLVKAMLLGYIGSVVGLIVANLFGSRLDSDEITTQFWAMTGGVIIVERFCRARSDSAAEGEGGNESA